MIPALCKRLLNARKRAPESDEKLTLLLREKNLGIEDLPEILSELHVLAELSHEKTLTPNEYDLLNLRKELEGECYLVKLLQRRIAKEDGTTHLSFPEICLIVQFKMFRFLQRKN